MTTTTSLLRKIQDHFGAKLADRRFALWAHDVETEYLVRRLVELGAAVSVHAVGPPKETKHGDRVQYRACHWNTVHHADALAIVADGPSYRGVDPGMLRWFIGQPVVFDLGNCLNMDWFKYGRFTLYRREDAHPHGDPALCSPAAGFQHEWRNTEVPSRSTSAA